jgi:hypothetical protein
MKKIVVAFVILIGIFLSVIYIFISPQISFQTSIKVGVDLNNAGKSLSENVQLHKWWPADSSYKNDSILEYKNYKYDVNFKMLNGDSVQITDNDLNIKSHIFIIPINKDTVQFVWQGNAAKETNPFNRFGNYFTQKKINQYNSELLNSLKNFLENKENIYGIKIEHSMVTDTLLISTKKDFDHYPSTAEIYDLLNNLKNFALDNGALQTNPPMLHVVADSGQFKTMVALPINKTIPSSNNFIIKKMIAGKILIAETKGGSAIAEAAIKKVEMYMDDYHILSPAISFQSLVTDRSKETDSTKWVTKIYYPIM